MKQSTITRLTASLGLACVLCMSPVQAEEVTTISTVPAVPSVTTFARAIADSEHQQIIVYLQDTPLFSLKGLDTITQVLAEQCVIALNQTQKRTPLSGLTLTVVDGQYQLLTNEHQLLVAFTEQMQSPQAPSLKGKELALFVTQQVRTAFNLTENQLAQEMPVASSTPLRTFTTKIQELVAATFQGQASWYGGEFHGRRTSSGEVFNGNSLTAAHRNLPFGTRIKVTNMNNGKAVVVRVTDRGPFAGRRVLDVSRGAATVLGMLQSGVAKVRVEVLRVTR
jgi:rare lipoprotein A